MQQRVFAFSDLKTIKAADNRRVGLDNSRYASKYVAGIELPHKYLPYNGRKPL